MVRVFMLGKPVNSTNLGPFGLGREGSCYEEAQLLQIFQPTIIQMHANSGQKEKWLNIKRVDEEKRQLYLPLKLQPSTHQLHGKVTDS